MRHVLLLALLLCLSLPSLAQDNSPTPYEIALQRIEYVERNGSTYLDLTGLALTELPPEIFKLTNLQNLVLDSNQLSSLPPEIGNLSNLQSLHLDNNQLSSLPPTFGNLSNLCFLDLRNNRFEQIPLELAPLKRLGTGENCDPAKFSIQGFMLDNSLMDTLPDAVVVEGASAILDYLENEAWWHLQRLILGGATGLGIVAAVVLGFRWRQRGKQKRKQDASG